MYPQHSRFHIETPRDESTRIDRDLIEAVKLLQDQDKNLPGRPTQAVETLTKQFKNIAETFPEGTLTQSQTSTNPAQLCALRATPSKHQQLIRSNTPGIIPAPLQNQIIKTYEAEHRTS